MFAFSWFLAVELICAEAQIKVSQSPKLSNRVVGESTMFYCGVGYLMENPDVDVYWWKVGEQGLLQSVNDSRKRFSPLEKGKATFQLLNISVGDRGLYYCGVKKQLEPMSNGTGTKLVVHVPPSPLSITYNETENNGSAAVIFECTTAEFYPENINISWYKNGLTVETGIQSKLHLSASGLYVVSSILEEASPVKSGATYTCLANHPTEQTKTDIRFIPESVTSTTNIRGFKSRRWNIVYGFAGCGFLFLSFITIACVMKFRKLRAGTGEATEQTPPVERQVPLNDMVQYSAINWSKSTKRKEAHFQDDSVLYIQTRTLRANNNPTYAVLELADSQKPRKFERNDERSEYAKLQTSQ
ncbi:tyrosine-protein phosphatase non-receptor type substrate 1-like isoform X1 [Mobula hypostoma]|uniref:tyrosine-protein phosphatase non-receptor type substrate 1-like isoform X1 n=1 Tax=Mobula hypostoma TaxID=723540 RepID=UPI002FC3915D